MGTLSAGFRFISRALGSPPRASGHWLIIGSIGSLPRFTPTCVGTFHPRPSLMVTPLVHPHVRGDIPSRGLAGGAAVGSPPRAWRHCQELDLGRSRRRFTPTCVGTFRLGLPFNGLKSVHPHVRGDIRVSVFGFPFNCGSPPRAWGHLRCPRPTSSRLRFTPTCLGTFESAALGDAIVSVHPHVRGAFCSNGKWSHRPTVHPHVRGDIRARAMTAGGGLGSPPRAWGHCK